MAVNDGDSKVVGAADPKDADYGRDHERSSDNFETESHESETQAGVKKVEAISKMWTTGGLIIAYAT
jgi:hypothetical protein